MADSITLNEEIIAWVGKIVQNLPQKTYHGEPSMRKRVEIEKNKRIFIQLMKYVLLL